MNKQVETIKSVNNEQINHEIDSIQINSLEETASERKYASGHEVMKQLRMIYNNITTKELELREWVKYYLLLKRINPIMTHEMSVSFANLLKNAKVKVLNLGQEDIYTAFRANLDADFNLTDPEALSR